MKIGEKIKELRKINNLTQKELANKLNIGQATICEWEKNQYEPTATHIEKLTKIFNINYEELFEEKNIRIENNKELNYKEKKLLQAFSLLSEDEKDKIIEDCEYFANKNTTYLKKQKNA